MASEQQVDQLRDSYERANTPEYELIRLMNIRSSNTAEHIAARQVLEMRQKEKEEQAVEEARKIREGAQAGENQRHQQTVALANRSRAAAQRAKLLATVSVVVAVVAALAATYAWMQDAKLKAQVDELERRVRALDQAGSRSFLMPSLPQPTSPLPQVPTLTLPDGGSIGIGNPAMPAPMQLPPLPGR